jgi:hypothetical protein
MSKLSELERAVLFAMVRPVEGGVAALDLQLVRTQVVSRENTGAGFHTTFSVTAGPPIIAAKSPLGPVGATVDGLRHALGFLLWLKAGRLHRLEGYSYDESTTGLDFERIAFSELGPRS